MGPSPSSDYLTAAQKDALYRLAKASVRHGLDTGRPLAADPAAFTGNAAAPGACFVTLRLGGALRGCIGSLSPRQPLCQDVADNAFNAAFEDPRFEPVGAEELDALTYHLSVLTPLAPLPFSDEADLLGRLRPGVDGVLLTVGRHRGFFLPSVWEELPAPEEFLMHLKFKAGLDASPLPPGARADICQAVAFGDKE